MYTGDFLTSQLWLRDAPGLQIVTDESHLQNTILDQAALSQHPLEVLTALSGEKSCCSLSQHSLLPGDHYKGLEDQGSVSYGSEDKIIRHLEGKEQTTAQQLSEGMSARLLLEDQGRGCYCGC